VILAGPALSALAIFHSSEWAEVVNVFGGNHAVAEERSSADATETIAANPAAAQNALLIIKTSFFLRTREHVSTGLKVGLRDDDRNVIVASISDIRTRDA